MKVRSTIVLILWVASLSAPLMLLHADECDMACCEMTENACPMEESSEKCPGMQAGTPIHPIPAVPVNTHKQVVIIANPAAIQVIPVDLQPDHTNVQVQLIHPLILLLYTPLLI